jgi:predicted HTH domain antitoxin
MKNLQVRVDDEEIDDLDELAEEMRLSRSELARSAIREGVRRLRAEQALSHYLNMEYSLSRAAQHAGVSIREMADLASSRGIPFFRYSLDELRRDRSQARTWIKG